MGASKAPVLTRREREVLVELCRPSAGPTAFNEPAATRDIASRLFVTEAAVKQHLLRLYDKLSIHDGDNRRRRLANVAFESGLVSAVDLGAGPDLGSAAAPLPAPEASAPSVALGRAALGRK